MRCCYSAPTHLRAAAPPSFAAGVRRNTALHWACTRGNLNIVQMLCEFDAAVNLPEKGGWYTPFHWAVLKGNIDVALYLVHECHANPLLPDKEGSTPLHTACR